MTITCPCCGSLVEGVKILIDPGSGTVSTAAGIERVTPMEMRMLQILMERQPTGLTTSSFIWELWQDNKPDTATVSLAVMLGRLREKLNRLGLSVVNTYGQEYRLCETHEVGYERVV